LFLLLLRVPLLVVPLLLLLLLLLKRGVLWACFQGRRIASCR